MENGDILTSTAKEAMRMRRRAMAIMLAGVLLTTLIPWSPLAEEAENGETALSDKANKEADYPGYLAAYADTPTFTGSVRFRRGLSRIPGSGTGNNGGGNRRRMSGVVRRRRSRLVRYGAGGRLVSDRAALPASGGYGK